MVGILAFFLPFEVFAGFHEFQNVVRTINTLDRRWQERSEKEVQFTPVDLILPGTF